MIRAIFSLISCIIFVVSLHAQTTVIPETQGFSRERLKRIDDYMSRVIGEEDISGSVVLIARKGKMVYHQAYGQRDREANDVMQRDDIFRLASMTKPITSVAVMMLYEQGKIRLDDPLSMYLPAFQNLSVLELPSALKGVESAESPITIRNLLTHTSGLVYHWDGRLGEAYNAEGIPMGLVDVDMQLEEGVELLTNLPLAFNPGTRWNYGMNTDVLSLLVEQVSGLRFDRFLKENIFDPLGMEDTYFFLPDNLLDRLAVVYDRRDDQPIERVPEGVLQYGQNIYSVDYPYGEYRSYFSGGAGLSSTAYDYFKFLQMLLNGGIYEGKRLLSPTTVAMMTRNQIGKLEYPDAGYKFGLGFRVHTNPSESGDVWPVGVYDWGGFFNTRFWVDPENEIIGIIMNQLYPKGDLKLHQTFRNLTYQAIIE